MAELSRLAIAAQVCDDRSLQLRIPGGSGAGPVTIEVTDVDAGPPKPIRTFGDLLDSGLFGLWADRDDIGDSVEYARRLREEAWTRASDPAAR